jgi:hypothetical protein
MGLISQHENGLSRIYSPPIQPSLTNHYFISIYFVIGKQEWNVGCLISLGFYGEGVATPGFYPLPTTIDVDRIAGWTHSQLVDELVQRKHGTNDASQYGSNERNATVGSLVATRHEYPKRLRPGILKPR